jgi:hypothetical protein
MTPSTVVLSFSLRDGRKIHSRSIKPFLADSNNSHSTAAVAPCPGGNTNTTKRARSINRDIWFFQSPSTLRYRGPGGSVRDVWSKSAIVSMPSSALTIRCSNSSKVIEPSPGRKLRENHASLFRKQRKPSEPKGSITGNTRSCDPSDRGTLEPVLFVYPFELDIG